MSEEVDYMVQLGIDKADAKAENEKLQQERDDLKEKYYELIMAVSNKYPNETRHETALKYIKKAEESKNEPAKET